MLQCAQFISAGLSGPTFIGVKDLLLHVCPIPNIVVRFFLLGLG